MFTLKLGLIGWDKFFRKDHTPVVFRAHDQLFAGEKRAVVDETLLETMRPQWLSELSSEVISRTLVSEDSAKN
jgi:hypothetical protein